MQFPATPRSIFLLLYIWIFCLPAHAQDTAFARKTMQTLCSEYYGGRGYVDSGDSRAAKYITEQFKLAGLKPVKKKGSYYQNFKFDVNTFPGRTDVVLYCPGYTKSLMPGVNFLLKPFSGGGLYENVKLLNADTVTFNDILSGKYKDCAIVFRDDVVLKSFMNDDALPYLTANVKALIELKNDKMLWSVGRYNISIPYIEVAKSAWDSTATSVTFNIENKFVKNHKTQNVIGIYRSPKNPDTFVVFSAHYDHLGKMGQQAYFPGANDNASGVAFMLDLAKTYASGKDTPKYSIAFIAFAGEEAGLVGSKFYTENPLIPLQNIKFLINMDLMGNGQDGMMAVNGSVFTNEYNKLVEINNQKANLKEIKSRGKAANSDHYWFTEKGVKAFFFYLLGDYPQYHDVYDTPEKPILKGYEGAFKLIREFVEQL